MDMTLCNDYTISLVSNSGSSKFSLVDTSTFKSADLTSYSFQWSGSTVDPKASYKVVLQVTGCRGGISGTENSCSGDTCSWPFSVVIRF